MRSSSAAAITALVTACYLARAKWRVLVLERRYLVGGACVTEEVFPGFKVSTAAYVNSLFRPEIIADLRLGEYGFEAIERNPASFSPFLDGRYLMLGTGSAKDVDEIAKFSKRDAENYPKYEAMLERVASVVEPTLTQVPPNLIHPTLGQLLEAGKMGRALQRLGPGMGEAIEVLTGAARPILDRWFESEELKGTIATDAIIGAFMAPSMPGHGLRALPSRHGRDQRQARRVELRARRNGRSDAGARARGGRSRRRDSNAKPRSRRFSRATGASPASRSPTATSFAAKRVASGVDCHLTFEKLVDPAELPPEFSDAVARISYSSASCKINVALERLPSFTALPGHDAGPQHFGTVHLCPDQDFIERAYDDAKYGNLSREPVVECTMPSSLDPTVAPPGKHLMSMFTQYAPYRLKEGPWTDALRNEYADRCFDIVERYAPGFKSSVIDRQILTPVDLEATFGLTGGSIFQGAMPLHQLFAFRPVAGFASYATPVKGLYLCGAAAHPGGGVMGAAGWNAARVMLRGG